MSTKQSVATKKRPMKKLRVNADNDYKLITCVMLLAGFGLIVLYSSSYYSEGTSMLVKQAIFTLGGLAIMMLIAEFLDYRRLKPYAFGLYLISILLIIAVITPLGITLNGARRWLSFKFFTFQPSEFVKLTLILVMAGFLSTYWKKLKRWQIWIIIGLMAAVPAGLILKLTNHLSAALIILIIAAGMMYIACPKDYWLLIFGVLLIIAIAAYIFYVVKMTPYDPGEPFRITRFRIWFDPFNEEYPNSYQVREGLYGIASGGLFGRGLGNSILKEGFLPEPYNDMIFAVLCEEMGLVGAAMVLYLFIYLSIRIFRIGLSAPDKFGFFICMGVMLHIASQVVLNILVVTNTIVNTGITLCFFSGGGSSLIFIYMEMGLVLSVARRIQNPRL